MAEENNNGGLYFIVGALVVAVVAMGAYFYADNNEMDGVIERTVEKVDDGASSSLNIEVDDKGFSASTENEN